MRETAVEADSQGTSKQTERKDGEIKIWLDRLREAVCGECGDGGVSEKMMAYDKKKIKRRYLL